MDVGLQRPLLLKIDTFVAEWQASQHLAGCRYLEVADKKEKSMTAVHFLIASHGRTTVALTRDIICVRPPISIGLSTKSSRPKGIYFADPITGVMRLVI